MSLSFDLRKKLCSFPVIIINAKFDVSYRVLLVLCVLFGNHFTGNVLGELEEPRRREALPPLLFLGEGKGDENLTGSNFPNLPVIPATEIIERNGVPEYIRGSLSSLCEKYSESQRKKVEQILLLLFNFNSQGEETGGGGQVRGKTDANDDDQPNADRHKQENFSSSSKSSSTRNKSRHPGGSDDKSKYRKKNKVKKTALPHQHLQNQHLPKKKTFRESYKSSKFRATSVPKSSPLIPTPEFQYYQRRGGDVGDGGGGVIQLPTLSTTPSSSSVVPPSFSIFPYYFPSTEPSFPSRQTLAFPASTTMSSALDPVQSVEMPTPPMPPTTTGPIYLYYLSSSSSAANTATISSSMQPPTTPVVESSVASKPTTIEP